MNNSRLNFFAGLFLCAIVLCVGAARDGVAAQLSFVPEDDETPGQVSLVIDHADKIAGMKVTLTYDAQTLFYVKAEKTDATSAFMHVVNDKNPGRLIIVMASAKGISGDNVALIRLEFAKKDKQAEEPLKISVTQLQLMNENLQDMPGDYPEYVF